MANTLTKTGIINGQTILPGHVTQSIDALTGTLAYDITISGSLTLTGSVSSLNGFTGNLVGTSSWASNAVSAVTASYSLSALSSSYSLSASHAQLADLATLATNAVYSDNTIITIRNVHSTTIAKGTPCFITGSGISGNVAGVVPADAGDPTLMPAGVIAGETLAVGASGVGLLDGFINGVNTNAFESGDEVFVAVGGGYTNVPPTGSALIQKLGNVEKKATNGSGVINGPGAARSVPNINPGYTWVGNSDWVATPIATSSLSVSSAVNSTTTQNISGQYSPSGSPSFIDGNLGILAGSGTLSSGVSSVFNPTQLSGKIFQTEFWVTATLASGSTTPTPMVNLYVESPGAGTFIVKEVGGATSNDDFCFTVMYLKP